jgi:hypothetical protein
MSIQRIAIPCVAALAVVSAAGGRASDADAGIAPFSAHYTAQWKDINVATSDLELKADAQAGHYLYTWVPKSLRKAGSASMPAKSARTNTMPKMAHRP